MKLYLTILLLLVGVASGLADNLSEAEYYQKKRKAINARLRTIARKGI